MIISKTPIRISFFGGGTDYPDYFTKFGGAALSTTIDKYIYITVKKLEGISEFKYKINYSKLEACNEIEEIKHPVVRACLNFLNIHDSIEIHVISDLPARSGTGSSSSFTVGLLNALYGLKGQMVSKERLANEAIHIEQIVLGERVGVQDQLAAAYGSLNFFDLRQDASFGVNRLILDLDRKKELENNLLMFYTGVSRYAHEILEEQISNTKTDKITIDLNKIKLMVEQGVKILTSDISMDAFGLLLDDAWETKKTLSSAITTTFLDDIYLRAKKAGALGGKLLGAGGGGFFIFYVNKDLQEQVRKSLSELVEVNFNFENDGTKIIFYTN
jgi:D-glycero-alpha-D-manno-heptose-7-phosphate kinase